MKQSEFDQYAANYDRMLAESLPGGINESGYYAEYKIALMAEKLQKTKPKRILDFGCGSGRSLPYLEKFFPSAELWGYDVSPESLKFAEQTAPQANLFNDWQAIGDVQFDAILAANVFHHIPAPERIVALKFCHKALAEKGQLFIFEHNPYNPLTRWVFERCPFDADAEMLSLSTTLALIKHVGFSNAQHGYTLFFPGFLAFLRSLESYLKILPFGAQYYVQVAK